MESLYLRELTTSETRCHNGGEIVGPVVRIIGADGMYFIDLGTGKVYNVAGKEVYQYIGDW